MLFHDFSKIRTALSERIELLIVPKQNWLSFLLPYPSLCVRGYIQVDCTQLNKSGTRLLVQTHFLISFQFIVSVIMASFVLLIVWR